MSSSFVTGMKRLTEHWDKLKTELGKLRVLDIRPNFAQEIFVHNVGDSAPHLVHFDIRPVTFKLPERSGAIKPSEIFVVVDGYIGIDTDSLNSPRGLRIAKFSTQVGYFRLSGNDIEHVYGTHYDFSLSEVGHPTFHAQVKSFFSRAQNVIEKYRLTGTPHEKMTAVLQNVRVPTAQMDFFAVVLQLGADHLMHKGSTSPERDAFDKLRLATAEIKGAGNQWPPFARSADCMRSLHWYPQQ